MSAVVLVFFVWFALVAAIGAFAIATAPQVRAPDWLRTVRIRVSNAMDATNAAVGRGTTAIVLWLAGWSFIIIVGWWLGLAAHRLQSTIDWPAFHWWQHHHLGGSWSRFWWTLTDIGAPRVTQGMALGGAMLVAILYARRPLWWAPSIVLILGYLAEKYSQIILKSVVHRGHPPTTHGTWPSGGMGRLLVVYGLLFYFVVRRFWPHSPRAWAAAWTLLALCASAQAYARLNNLEHWTTDVAGGAIYGLMLLGMMLLGYSALARVERVGAAVPVRASVALPREPVA